MTNDTTQVCRKMVNALRKAKSDQFALGYLESFLSGVITRYVTDMNDLARLETEIMTIALDYEMNAK